MKNWRIPFLVVIFLLLAACGNDNADQKDKTGMHENGKMQQDMNNLSGTMKESEKPSSDGGKSEEPLTEQQVLAAVKEQLKGTDQVALPETVPLTAKGQHLTAKTASEGASDYLVTFFESATPIPINNDKLNEADAATKLATVERHRYDSEQAAKEAVGHETFAKSGGQATDLGYGLTGYQDAGAGQKYLGWNEGRWALSIHASNMEGTDYLPLAQKMVAKLEKESLPIPNSYGRAAFEAAKTDDPADNQLLFQDGPDVYTITHLDPLSAVDMATHFEQNK
ncbi:hypothetical protein [Listeria costaricensis]|uniref:hypothetical protein n=1 Tax=Listeria costaricensis TaxID=2026604 RepID=UPI000C07DDD9|nr:hypothetical protein [Listeria costaricensis]